MDCARVEADVICIRVRVGEVAMDALSMVQGMEKLKGGASVAAGIWGVALINL